MGTTHTAGSCLVSPPHSSSSFQDRAGGLMNSLLIPLAGESDCSGRSSRGLGPAEAAWAASYWAATRALSLAEAQPTCSTAGPPLLPPPVPCSAALSSPASISVGADPNLVFLELAAICLSHTLVLVGALRSLSHSWAVGCSCLCPDGQPVCLSFLSGILTPSSSLPVQFLHSFLPLSTWDFLPYSLFLEVV